MGTVVLCRCTQEGGAGVEPWYQVCVCVCACQKTEGCAGSKVRLFICVSGDGLSDGKRFVYIL